MISGEKEHFTKEDLINFYEIIDEEDLSKYKALQKQKHSDISEASDSIMLKIY